MLIIFQNEIKYKHFHLLTILEFQTKSSGSEVTPKIKKEKKNYNILIIKILSKSSLLTILEFQKLLLKKKDKKEWL